jgi:hypothetical protein
MAIMGADMATHELVGGSQDGQKFDLESDEATGFRLRRSRLDGRQLTEIYELRSDSKFYFIGYSFPNPPVYDQQFQDSLNQELFGILARLGPPIQELGKHFERRGGRLEIQIDQWLITPIDRPLPD